MAINDIRIKLSFRGHRKRKRLRRILGPASDTYLLDFWISVAESRPSGDLTGWSPFDIADAADYPGDPHEFYTALVDTGFIDVNQDGQIQVHNWQRRQGYVAHSERRSLQGRMAIAKRWGDMTTYTKLKEKLYGKQPLDTDSITDSSSDSNTPYPLPLPKDYKVCSEKTCNKPVDQPHHSKCRSCYSPNYRDPPTGRVSSYPTCPYCKREQSGLIINHQDMTCSICEDETT